MCGVKSGVFQPGNHMHILGSFSVTGNHFGVGMYSKAKWMLLDKTRLLADLCWLSSKVPWTWLSLYCFFHTLDFKVSLKESFFQYEKINQIWNGNTTENMLLCKNPLSRIFNIVNSPWSRFTLKIRTLVSGKVYHRNPWKKNCWQMYHWLFIIFWSLVFDHIIAQ